MPGLLGRPVLARPSGSGSTTRMQGPRGASRSTASGCGNGLLRLHGAAEPAARTAQRLRVCADDTQVSSTKRSRARCGTRRPSGKRGSSRGGKPSTRQ
eukprot:355657-Chlamydomonas_euryale.AAC.4